MKLTTNGEHKLLCCELCFDLAMLSCFRMDGQLYNPLSVKEEKLGPYKERKKHDRFNGMPEEEVQKRTLPDHLTPNLDIIIVSTHKYISGMHQQICHKICDRKTAQLQSKRCVSGQKFCDFFSSARFGAHSVLV